MNIWRRGRLSDNPYYRTAFRVGRVPREVLRHRTIVQLVGQTRRIVKAGPLQHTISGKTVSDAEVNRAEGILSDPRERILEELLHHRTEKPSQTHIQRMMQKICGLMAPEPMENLKPENPAALLPIALGLVNRLLDVLPSPDPLFGQSELRIVPPFGLTEEGCE
jgi:hypothetical protein